MLEAMKLDLFPQLRNLRVPTLVINGRFDANVAPTVAYGISKAIPGSKLEYFERSGHSPYLEEPDKFELVISNFLNRLRAGLSE
jgi:proline iminopeptidase